MKINVATKTDGSALGNVGIGTTIGIMCVVNAEDLDSDGFHEFLPGTGISSSQMNDNFDQVAIDFNALDQSIDQISESIDDLDDSLGIFERTIAIDGANIGISGSVSATDLYGDGSSLTNLDANRLTSGTVATSRLGTGTADSTTFLRGDGTWATSAAGVGGSGSAGYLPLFTNGTTIGNSAIYQSGSNVGIGTSSPGTTLEVSGPIRTILNPYLYPRNVASIVSLGISGNTGACNWALRGVYQYGSGVSYNADGGDLDLIKSYDGNTGQGHRNSGSEAYRTQNEHRRTSSIRTIPRRSALRREYGIYETSDGAITIRRWQ